MQQESKLNSVIHPRSEKSTPSSSSIRRVESSNLSSSSSPVFQNKAVWRHPGHFEIPDILGNAFLKAEPPIVTKLRPLDLSKHVSHQPWYPPNPHYQIPSLPPLQKSNHKKL